MSLTDKFSYLKRKRKLTTEDIASLSGLAMGTLNKIFSGATKNPAAKTLDTLATAFGVPVRYLTDDSIPVYCDIGMVATAQGLFMATEEEFSLIQAFRALSMYDQRALLLVLGKLQRQISNNSEEPVRTLMCYLPTAEGAQGVLSDFLAIRPLLVPLNAVTIKADLAVQITGHSLEPAIPPGTILALKAGQPRHGMLGAFLLNQMGFIRKYYHKHGLRKLVALNTSLKDIVVSPTDELECLGIVLGKIPDYQWL